jgi:hypothetical protein
MTAEIVPGAWVKSERNIGLVVKEADPNLEINERIVYVKWLPKVDSGTTKAGKAKPAYERAFANVIPTLMGASALRGIEEPKLTREEAACYAALTPSRLYQLRNEGWFGGPERDPFYAFPTELDAYAAAPKATNRWQVAEVKKQQEDYKKVGAEKRTKKPNDE